MSIINPRFEKLQRDMGFNHVEAGLLQDVALRQYFLPIDCVAYDWMHIYLVNGLYHHEATLLVSMLQKHCSGAKQKDLNDYFASFTWPKKLEAASATARDTFKKKAMESVKSSASEALSMFPVLRSFCSELPTKNAMILPALKSFYALCTVLELLKVVNECNVTSDSLRNAIQAHLNLFQECYGPDLLPKGHLSLHLPLQITCHKRLLSCFVHERRHKEVKRYANMLTNHTISDQTILQEVQLSHFVHLEEDLHLFGFNFVPPKPEVARFFMSHFGLDLKDVNSLLWSTQGPKGNHGDFVSIREPSCIAELWGHFQFKENFVSLVSPLEKVGKNKFQKKGSLIFVESTGIMGSVFYRNEAEDVIYVVPEQFEL